MGPRTVRNWPGAIGVIVVSVIIRAMERVAVQISGGTTM